MIKNEIDCLTFALTKSGVPENALDGIEKLFKLVHYKKGDPILNVGDMWETLHVVIKGVSEFFYVDRNGNKAIKAFTKSMQVFAPVGYALHNPSRFYITALTDMEVYECECAHFKKHLESRGEYHYFCKMADVLLEEKICREIDLLQLNATHLYLKFLKDNEEIIPYLPISHIASYLGITNVSLSRIRSNLNKSIQKHQRK